MDSDSETCNMALENIFRGATHFKLVKTDVGGPRSAFFGKNMPINSLIRPSGEFNIWLRQMPCHRQIMEFDSETCNMALNNVLTGVTHFELAKTDIGGPR